MARIGTVKLSQTHVNKLTSEPILKRVWDSVIPGFHVRVYPSGAKSYAVQFQRKDGTKVQETIGPCAAWALEDARKKAGELRTMHDGGRDIKAVQAEVKDPRTVSGLADLWREHFRERLKPSSRASYDSLLRGTILPALGSRLVKDVTYADIAALHRKEKRQHPTNANRAVAVLSRLFAIAEREGWREHGTNPCRGVEKVPEGPRERLLSSAEYAAFGKALEAEDPIFADVFRFLALSGLRKGEALGLRWADVDLESRTMTFRDHKTRAKAGTKVLPLNTGLLKILQRRSAQSLNPYVFAGHVTGQPLVNIAKAWSRIAKAAKIEGATPHDLRRGFMTCCVELGFGAAIADTLLGHSLGKIRDTYMSVRPDGILAQASEGTAAWIAAAMRGEPVRVGHGVPPNSEVRNA